MRTVIVSVPASITFEMKASDGATDDQIKQQAADSLNAALDEYQGFQLDLEDTVNEGIEVVKAHDFEILDDSEDASTNCFS